MNNKINIKDEQKKFAKGFTLLELLVVVLIIAILAAIALPQYKLAALKSKYATMKDIARVVTEAQHRYFIINGDYTKDFNDLDIVYPGLYNSAGYGNNIKINGGYCALYWWDKPNQGIICILTRKHKLSYSIIYKSNDRVCRVMDHTAQNEDTLEDKVCKLETGATPTYFSSSTLYKY